MSLIERLKNPENHYKFADPKKANAVLMSLCQEAADALAAQHEPENEPHVSLASVQDNDAHYKGVVEGVQKLFDGKRAQPAPVQDLTDEEKSDLWAWSDDTTPPAQPAPVLSAGPITPEMANWSESDKAELAVVMARHLTTPPAQPAPMQEPFGYFKAEPFGWTDCAETDEGAIALYEHLAVQRPWVGLTDEEMNEIWADQKRTGESITRAIETKLRSKNNG